MDSERIKGAAQKFKGSVKETAEKAVGDKKLETEGNVDKAKGTVRNTAAASRMHRNESKGRIGHHS